MLNINIYIKIICSEFFYNLYTTHMFVLCFYIFYYKNLFLLIILIVIKKRRLCK